VDDGWWRPKAKGEKAQRKPPADLAESYKLKARHSAALIVVLTGEFGEGGVARSSYFESKYCVMEYRGALAAGKPIVFVLEADPAHGGIPMQTHLDELASAQGDHWKNEDGTDDTVARNLLRQHWERGLVVPWQRVRAFQDVSLRLVLQRLLEPETTLHTGSSLQAMSGTQRAATCAAATITSAVAATTGVAAESQRTV